MFKLSAIVLYTLSGAMSILDFFKNCYILFYCTHSEIFYFKNAVSLFQCHCPVIQYLQQLRDAGSSSHKAVLLVTDEVVPFQVFNHALSYQFLRDLTPCTCQAHWSVVPRILFPSLREDGGDCCRPPFGG